MTDLADHLRHELTTRGIVALPGAYRPAVLAALNERLDPLFASSANGAARSYVGADTLAELGLLDHVFPTPVRAAIDGVCPDDQPVLYHCHVYEIAGSQHRPHIRDRTLDGWHRDSETVVRYQRDVPCYVSLFAYLTDVGTRHGAFELVPQPPLRAPANGTPCVSVRGGPGFTFLWNRSYFHRASPNISPVRRRVLKLSIQPASLPNGRLLNDELVGARHQVGDDPWLHALLGGPSIADRSPLTSTAAVATHPVVPNDEVELRPIQVATYHAAELARSVRRWARPA